MSSLAVEKASSVTAYCYFRLHTVAVVCSARVLFVPDSTHTARYTKDMWLFSSCNHLVHNSRVPRFIAANGSIYFVSVRLAALKFI